jgi:hypothetical protein
MVPAIRALPIHKQRREGASDMRSEHHHTWEVIATQEAKTLGDRGIGVDKGLTGLAISGGGIRSATFALGVLESLKEKGLLEKFHYLSTVSGGGYIGSWLSAGCQRNVGWMTKDFKWREPIAHLRRYSNYLSPQVGFFSADTWSMLTIWFRNALLIQATLICGLACVLALPRPLVQLFHNWPAVGNWRWATIMLFVFGIVGIAGNQLRLSTGQTLSFLKRRAWPVGLVAAIVLGAVTWVVVQVSGFDPFDATQTHVNYWLSLPIAALMIAAGFCLQPVAVTVAGVFMKDRPDQVNYTQAWVQFAVIVPLMIVAFLVTSVLWAQAIGTHDVKSLKDITTYGALVSTAWQYWPFHLSVVFVSFWLLSFCSVQKLRVRSLAIAAGAPIVAVPTLHALLSVIVLLFQHWNTMPGGEWRAFVWGPALVAGAFVLAIIVLIGMMGVDSSDEVREWWSRLGAWLGIYATAWMIIAVTAIYGPYLVDGALRYAKWSTLTAAAGWIATVAGGLFAGNSSATGGEAKTTSAKAKEVVAAVAPFVFIAGLLIAVAYVINQIVFINGVEHNWWDEGASIAADSPKDGAVAFTIIVASAVATALLGWRIDINQFSLSAFYRNRLVRCYLGATRQPGTRKPQNFTGFDDHDDLQLAELADPTYKGPLHIVNCSLNLGGSSDLALHTRHSAVFTLTPIGCGTWYRSRDQQGRREELGYVDTAFFGSDGGPTLGQAVAVSGAAASPNMGYHTSPVTAFLLTMFNVRLGWWFPNPRTGGSYPHFNLTYLLAELFGIANDKSSFVNISDGGHFENLAAYELIRRKCRLIVISDAECDDHYTFEGLGTLIRVCEVDFQCTITIDVEAIRPSGAANWSARRWAVGDIQYKDGTPGTLIYLKASMVGTEDTSVLQYKSSHNEFPHESTGDQFYGEDQFESYRHLGRTIAKEAFESFPEGSELFSPAERLRLQCPQPARILATADATQAGWV